MTRTNKRPAASSTTVGAPGSSANSTRYQKKQSDNDAIWDVCREAQYARAERETQKADNLRAAALNLDFTRNESGRWVKKCPGCGDEVGLYTTLNGDLRASGSSTCAAVPELQIRLRKWGLQ